MDHWHNAQLNCPLWRPNCYTILLWRKKSEIGEITLLTRRIMHAKYVLSLAENRKIRGAIVRHVFPQNPEKLEKNFEFLRRAETSPQNLTKNCLGPTVA